jgi:hypothetical protein
VKWPREKFALFAIIAFLDQSSPSMIDSPSTMDAKRIAPFDQLAAGSQQLTGIKSFASLGIVSVELLVTWAVINCIFSQRRKK